MLAARGGLGVGLSAVATVAMLTFAVTLMVPGAYSTRFRVGDALGWTNNVNYTLWANNHTFYLGDWLFFWYDRTQKNVLEVNKTAYDNCTADHPLVNWSRGGGRDVVPLDVCRHYYFISGNGFCYSGMKLAIHVVKPPPPPRSAPSNGTSGASGFSYRDRIALPAAFAMAAVWDSILQLCW